jgi:nitronate monooxygenase
MFETRITKLFGIKYPIICGGMLWLGRAELAAAVANAGGLGFITAATFADVKDLRAEIREGDTAYVMRSIGSPTRVAKNALTDSVLEMEARGTTIEELLPIIGGHSNAAFEQGDIEAGFSSMGQSVGMIHDVPTVKELIDRMLEEASEARKRIDLAIPQKVAP